jgi:Ser/Thr protein kinase RdoA (MazF antagonist)
MTATADDALRAFGIGDARIRPEPSFSSVLYRISADGRRLFLKEHTPHDAPRIELAAQLSDRLRSHGLIAPHFLRTAEGGLYARSDAALHTLTEPVGDRPLSVADLRDHDSACRLGQYLARVHAALNDPPAPDPPPSALWRHHDPASRHALLPDTMLRALAVVGHTPAALAPPLATVAGRIGVVHGDFWPGNVIVGAARLFTLGVVDLESACRAPLLLDVAHFADLGFRSLVGWHKTREMDLSLATTFARAYATASSMPLDELRVLPDLLVAARGCSIRWLAQRHLDIGPNRMDQLVENDLSTIRFVTRNADRWSDQLSATRPAAATVGS